MTTADDKGTEPRPGARVYRVVETDNYGGDYPNESWVGPCMKKATAEKVADLINKDQGEHGDRFWKVVHEDYKLAPGFEP